MNALELEQGDRTDQHRVEVRQKQWAGTEVWVVEGDNGVEMGWRWGGDGVETGWRWDEMGWRSFEQRGVIRPASLFCV